MNPLQNIKSIPTTGPGLFGAICKYDKGLPMNMLHLEYYNKNFDLNPVVWELNQEKPNTLLNPETLFK